MSTILFVTWDGGGNVPPALGIAAELRRRGHDVRVMGHPTQQSVVGASGLGFRPFSTAREFDSRADNSPFDLLSVFGDRAMGRDVIAELETRPADLVVVDCLLWGPMEALAAAGRPYAVLEHVFDEFFTRKWLRGPMGIGIALKRFRAKRILDQAEVRLVASLPQLDPAATKPLPANVRHTGPVVTGRPADAERPTVLVSLSTTNFPGMADVMQNVLDALETLDVHGIVTTGPALDASTLRPPPNAEVHQFLPHAEVLPRVNLVVGHGGHSTTMAALAHHLPLIVLPLHPMLDQAMVGRALEAAGAGRLLPKKAVPAQIAEAMTDLLAEGPHRSAAAELGLAIRDAKGAATAADVIESLAVQGATR